MGLFGKKKAAAPLEQPTEPRMPATSRTEWETTWVSLAEKMLRVELVDEKARLEPVLIRSDENHIRLICGGVLVAEVGKRGKAYKELEPLIGKVADIMLIEERTGEYGLFYRVGLRFKSTVIIIPD